MSDAQPPVTPRHAASAVIVRAGDVGARVLMGLRPPRARFMPSRMVFPGGAVDPEDETRPATPLSATTARRLVDRPEGAAPSALLWAMVREVFEETGLVIACASLPRAAAAQIAREEGWERLVAAGYTPDTARCRFFFRAITPADQPIRFDARFFLVRADDLIGVEDALQPESDELSELRWLTFAEAREAQTPTITRAVLKEAEAALRDYEETRAAPFFRKDGEERVIGTIA